jgi:tetratricopeptide (TPR) repeat protein
MSKKQKRRQPAKIAKPGNLTPREIADRADKDLAAGRFRDAVSGYKQLLKQEPRAEWFTGLAEAYAGRARELTAKGMLKEALVMWENRAGLGECAPPHPDHLTLLLRAGQIDSARAMLGDLEALEAAERDRVRTLLAAHSLAGQVALVERLPADDPVVLHAAPARAALAAYCAGDDAAVLEALRGIPFRSPYRDWVQILKALQRLPERPQEAAELLVRVPDESPFSSLKQAAQLAVLPEGEFIQTTAGRSDAVFRLACALRGWPPERIGLRGELDRLGPEPRPEALLRLMHRHRSVLGDQWVRHRGMRLLIRDYPTSLKWLGPMGARPLSREETSLVTAWMGEARADPGEQAEHWEAYARALMSQCGKNKADADCKLRIALALRRCEQTHHTLEKATGSYFTQDVEQLVARQLEQSLSWDPEDRDTYLRLIGYHHRGKRLKVVRRFLDLATERWPKDMRVLETALDTALDAGSFKKASAIAREMLALDPINTGVRERLVDAHLAHARKQIPKGRPDLARKEIDQGREWARSSHAREQLDLTAGLITLTEDAKVGAAELKGLIERLGGGLAAHCALALAGEAIKQSPQALASKVGLKPPSAARHDDLLAALARLRTHADRGGRLSRELNAYLTKAFANVTWGSTSHGELEAACDTLRRCGLHKVRLSAARAALKRWRGAPVFELHAFEAKHPDDVRGLAVRDLWKLEEALERAREEGDNRIAMRIQQVLAEHSPFGIGGRPVPFLPPEPPMLDPGEGTDAIAAMIEIFGLDRMLDLLDLPPPMKRKLKNLERQIGKEALTEILISFIQEGDDGTLPDITPPLPRPPKGRKSKGRHSDDPEGDDPFSDQLDLFE